MNKNMGTIDRVIRAVIALAIAALYFTGWLSGTVAIVLGIGAVVFLLTSLVSWCPIYTLFGLSSRQDSKA